MAAEPVDQVVSATDLADMVLGDDSWSTLVQARRWPDGSVEFRLLTLAGGEVKRLRMKAGEKLKYTYQVVP